MIVAQTTAETELASEETNVNSKHLHGLAVISIADGEKVGTIDRVFVDMSAKRIAGFSIAQSSGMLHLQPGGDAEFVDADDVHALGPDAMTLSDRNAVRGDSVGARLDSLIELGDLLRHKVVTDGGTSLGQVASLEFEPTTFAVDSLEVSPGFFQSNIQVPAEQVLNVGSELVVVEESVIGPAADETTPVDGASAPPADAGRMTPATDS